MSSFCSHIRRYCAGYLSSAKVAAFSLWLLTTLLALTAIYAKHLNNALANNKLSLSKTAQTTSDLQNILNETTTNINSSLQLFGASNANTTQPNQPTLEKLFHQELLSYFSQNTNSTLSLISIEFNQNTDKLKQFQKNFQYNWSCEIQLCALFNDLENLISFIQNKNLPLIITSISTERTPKYNLFHKTSIKIDCITPLK